MLLHFIRINHIIFVLAFKAKGRPPKDYEITEDMKINELKYIIVRKDSKIKRLKMENKLMRDFPMVKVLGNYKYVLKYRKGNYYYV